MAFLDEITVLMLSFNEERNIGRALAPLQVFRRVILVDSGSTDRTVSIAGQFQNVSVVEHHFISHADQWNFGLSLCPAEEWTLALDADYVLTPAFIDELRMIVPPKNTVGYAAAFDFLVFGKKLRSSLYPPVTCLFRTGQAKYRQDGHTQRVVVDGKVDSLRSRICHDDRKALGSWVVSQQRYAALEAEHLLSAPWSKLSVPDKLRVSGWLAPPLVFVYVLFVRGCVFDGRRGVFYALQRAIAEALLVLELQGRRIEKSG